MNKKRDFQEELAMLTPADFDGHTEFVRLEPEEKLAWLSAAARFWVHVHGDRLRRGMGRARGPAPLGWTHEK